MSHSAEGEDRAVTRSAAEPVSSAAEHSLELADYPALYQVADRASGAGQAAYRRRTLWELALVVAGAVCGALGAVLPAQSGGAAIATLRVALVLTTVACFIAALLVKQLGRLQAADRDWFDGRAVAETIKSQAWRFMLRVPPFAEDASADRVFAAALTAVLRARAGLRQSLESLPVQPEQVTPRMRGVRDLPIKARRDVYARYRLADQVEWYRRKAIQNQAAAERWFRWAAATQILAVALGVVQVFVTLGALRPGLAVAGQYVSVQPLDFMGVAAALAASFLAWAQLGRHDELARSYALAYQELLLIRGLAERAETEEDLQQVVRDGEGAISREHTMWMAKRADPLPAPEVAG